MMTAAEKERLELADELRDLSLVLEDLADRDIFYIADQLRAVAARLDDVTRDLGAAVFRLDEWREAH